MKHVAIVSFVVLVFCACKPDIPVDGASKGNEPAAAAQGQAPVAQHRTDKGDVEQYLGVEARLHPDSKTENIQAEESGDAMSRQRLLNLVVTAPYPDHLWLTYTIRCREAFADRPVVLRLRVVAETGVGDQRRSRDLASFATVLGKDAKKNTFEEKVDVLAGIETIPETMLVKVIGEALLMADGADEASIDPKTATVDDPDDLTTALPYLVPVRIDFKPKE